MKQQLALKQTQRLRPTVQLQQSLRVLQCASLALHAELALAVESNPFLEQHNEPTNSGASTSTVPLRSIELIAAEESLSDRLKRQLVMHHPVGHNRMIADVIIDCLDENGYLDVSFDELRQIVALGERLTDEKLEHCLRLVQSLEPTGVGARDLRECLLLQLDTLAPSSHLGLATARLIVDEHLELMAARHYAQLSDAAGVSENNLQLALKLIRTLNPRPGESAPNLAAHSGPPDLIAKRHAGVWQVRLHPANEHRLYLNEDYWNDFPAPLPPAAQRFLRQQFRDARWWLQNIALRHQTMLAVGQAIVTYQSDYLEDWTASLKALTLHDIAVTLGVHTSTVSRAISEKTILTPRAMLPLKRLFSGYLVVEGGNSIASAAIKDRILKMIQYEQPKARLSDGEIARVLKSEGVQIARRTVTKYRTALRIPAATGRRQT